MSSETPNQKSQPNLPPSRPQLSPQEEQMLKMTMEIQQLRRAVWLLVKAAGGTATIDERTIPPLWELGASRPNPNQRQILTLTTRQMKEPGEDVIRRLAEHLKGTGLMLAEVIDKFHLAEFPLHYLELRLVPYVRQGADGIWAVDSTTRLQEDQRN